MITFCVTKEEYEDIKLALSIPMNIPSRHGVSSKDVHDNEDEKIKVYTIDGDMMIYKYNTVVYDYKPRRYSEALAITLEEPKVWISPERRIVELLSSIDYVVNCFEFNTKDITNMNDLKQELKSCTENVVERIKKVINEDVEYISMLEKENKKLRKKHIDK